MQNNKKKGCGCGTSSGSTKNNFMTEDLKQKIRSRVQELRGAGYNAPALERFNADRASGQSTTLGRIGVRVPGEKASIKAL